MIDLGAQVSGKESYNAIHPFHVELLEIFYDPPEMNGYFKNINEFQIVFRVSGEGTNFEGEGPEYLKVSKKQKVISVDFTIPESCWKNINPKELKTYVSNGIKDCFAVLRERALKLDEVINLKKLDHDFMQGMELFNSK